jgi:hypothetical protein
MESLQAIVALQQSIRKSFMQTIRCLVVLVIALSQGMLAGQEQGSKVSDEVLASKPSYYYLPIKSKVVSTSNRDSESALEWAPWKAVATHGVQIVETNEEMPDRSAMFDGMSLVELDGSGSFDVPSISVEFWFRSDQVWDAKYWPGSATLVSKFTSGWASSDWGIIGGSLNDGVNEGRVLVGVGPRGGGDVVLASPPGVNDGGYHHIVWTRSGTGENVLYVDGKPVDRVKENGGTISNTRPIQIGGESWEKGGRNFRGSLSAIAIYTHVLSEERVKVHFDAVRVAPKLPSPIDREVDFVKDIKPLLVTYCFDCHGPGLDQGGFSMGTRTQVLEGGESGPGILVGRSFSSAMVHRISGVDPGQSMPPDREGMTREEIGLIRAWIDQGALWPASEEIKDPREMIFRSHWAFRPLRQPALPELGGSPLANWILSPVDLFIAKELKNGKLEPAPWATRYELLRRVYFDLTGLPPTPDQIRAFMSDDQPDAYVHLVEELLGSSAYAERWARHWLDVVRYADSGGFETDILYEQAWHYRDYVIRSLAENKPIDRFLMEQVGGDELWPDKSEEMADAVALWTLGPWQNALDQFPEMLEYVRRTDQVSTFGEAMLGLTVGCANCHNHKYDPISQRDYFGLEAVFAASETWDRNTDKKGWGKGERNHYRILRHASSPTPIRLLGRGELNKPRGLVSPSIPSFFPQGGELTGGVQENLHRRAQLAKWLVSPANPLTARSFVNRVWQWHFGRGIAATPNDLGIKGSPPTHPELLDWLAVDFCESGWDLKHLHRRILHSATYQQSVQRSQFALQTDPQNQLLSSFPSRRLSAEEVWDHLHAAAGTLELHSYGAPIVPALSDEELLGIYDIEQNTGKKWPVTTEQNRRAIYILNRRSFRFPFFEAFDPPNNSISCPTRQTTTVPAQALTMMNNALVARQARAMSERLVREAGGDEAAQIELAWLLAYNREITDEEREAARDFLSQSRAAYEARGVSRPSEHSLADLCLAIFNTSEFISAN